MKITRKEALAAIERYYFTGKPCKRGHHSKRLTVTGACLQCVYETDRILRQEFSRQLREKEITT